MIVPKLRLLYSSNIMGCPSGYGVQSAALLPRLAMLPEFGGPDMVPVNDGYVQYGVPSGRTNIAMFAWYGLHGLKLNLKGFEIYPGFDDPYGNDVIGAHAQHFGANIVIPLIDAWVLRGVAKSVAPALFCPWFPVDHTPTPDAVLKGIEGAYMPLSYSKWGHEQLLREGVENTYIPHGIDTSIFKVLTDRANVATFKRNLTGIDNAFLCVMVAANKGFPDRKWFQGQLEVFRDFARDVPEARLYLHTLPTGHYGGLDFKQFAARLGMDGKLIFPNPYMYRLGYPPEFLTLVYNAADVLLGVSRSEGFGIPIVEAQACGCPVIVTNFSAMPELVRWGHAVEVESLELTGMMSYQAIPSKASMVDKLGRLYEAWDVAGGDWPLAKRIATQDAIHAEYDWDAIVRDQWAPFMAKAAEDAPPLNAPYQAAGVELPRDDVSAFVDALNEGLQDEAKPRPKRRVAPLVAANGNGEAVTA